MTFMRSLRSSVEQSARNLLYGSKLFFPVRRTYQRLVDPQKWQFWQGMMTFYAPFIRPGDLVFDVGANVGTYSQVFLQMDATVVAIEPNDDCCASLLQLAKLAPRSMFLERVALGDRVGTAEFHVSDQTGLSTMNDQWSEVAGRSTVYGGAKWVATRTVPIVTLDSLAKKYGVPSFIKIDVEGYEDHVLTGMSFLPGGISFEFHPSMLNVALNCLRLRHLAENYLFNYNLGETAHPELTEWVDAKAMCELLSGLDCEFGDILAHRRG
jgi:FkbM family methyltransferase